MPRRPEPGSRGRPPRAPSRLGRRGASPPRPQPCPPVPGAEAAVACLSPPPDWGRPPGHPRVSLLVHAGWDPDSHGTAGAPCAVSLARPHRPVLQVERVGAGGGPAPGPLTAPRCPRPPCPSRHPDVLGPGGPSRPPTASSFLAWAARGQAVCDCEAFNPLGNGRRSFNYLRRQRKRRSPQTLCTVGRRPGRGPALRGQAGSGAACGRPASRVTSSKAQGRRAAGPQGARCVRSFLTSPLRSPEARERAAVLPWAQRPGRAG